MVAATPLRSVAVCIDTRDGAGRSRLHGVAQVVRRLGWRMMLVRESGKTAAREVVRLGPEGIVAYIADRWLVNAARKLGVPLVDTALGELSVPMSVALDNDAIGRLAAEHFRSAGLKHFAYCGVLGRLASGERRAGFAVHLGDARLWDFAEPVAEGESRLEALMEWLGMLPKPAGLLVFDDKLGERVLTACRWAGLTVPQQVAVLGIGNDELMCEVCWPGLSSISLPTSRLGFEAATMLDRAMAGETVPQPHRKLQPVGVVVRASTDVVAVDDGFVKSAIQYIRVHARDFIGVEDVALALGVSRSTLDRRFAEALGRSVHQELVRVRMQLARTMLGDRSLGMAEVARGCGYATPASFSRAFRQHAGRWPTEYRDEIQAA